MAVSNETLLVVTAVYLAVIFSISYMGYKKTKGAGDYLLGGRKIHPAILALSYGATFISTSAIVGFGGLAGHLGMSLIWLTVLNISIGILLAFVVFGKRTRRLGKELGAMTFPELLSKRYDSKFLRKASSVIILAGMPIYTAAILIGGARFIESTLGMPYDTALLGFAAIVAAYVILGGIIAVMYTDALQGTLMMIGMSALLILTYVKLGGIGSAHAALSSLQGSVSESLAAAGHAGWTSMPLGGSTLWYTLITTIVLGVGIGVLAQPQLIVRFMTVENDMALNRAVLIGGPFIIMMTGAAFTIGALTNVYFYTTQGQLSIAAAGGNIDAIIPTYISSSMPDILVVLFMVVLLSAAMSTLSSLLHSMGTTLGYDLIHKSGKGSLKTSQIGTFAMIVVSVAVAYMMPTNIIARATAMFMGLCAAAFLPPYVHALYSKAPSKAAAKASLIAGSASWLVWTAFVHVKESSALGISQALFGKDAVLAMPWQVIDPLIVSLPISACALAIALLAQRNLVSDRIEQHAASRIEETAVSAAADDI